MKLKKSIVAIIAIVAVCALSLCVFVGCNNNDEKGADASIAETNAETLGTAVAAAASYMGGATAGAMAEETEEIEDGINFEFEANASVSGIGVIKPVIDSAIEAMKPVVEDAIEPFMEQGIQAVKDFVGDKKVDVTTAESDKDGYNTKIIVTISDINADGEEVVFDEYVLYLNIKDGESLDSKEFSYTASLVITVNEEEIELFAFEGTASYDADLGSVAFNFSLGALADMAGVDFTATATKDGNVLLTIGADALDSFSASVSVEIGKLADGKYGATVTVAGNMDISLAGVAIVANFEAIVTVSGAEVVEGEEYSFDLGGSVDIDASMTYGGMIATAEGSATLNGQAKYNVAEDELTFGINGTVALDYAVTQAE